MTTTAALRTSLTAIAAALRACADTVDCLARTVEEPSSVLERQVAFWPDFMSTSLAARYCGYKTTGALRKARLDGKIRPSGKRGGAGSWTWARADLDAFLRGHAPTSTPRANASTIAPTSTFASEDALRRIHDIAREAHKR